MTLSFREIKDDDFSVCADILSAAYNGAPWNNSWTKEEALLRIESTMSGFNARGYVVEKNNQIIGMCLGRIDYYYNNWSQFCLDEFNVSPLYQGTGVGKNLLTYTAKILKAHKIKRIFLTTGGKEAAQFYQKNGFILSKEGIMMEANLSLE